MGQPVRDGTNVSWWVVVYAVIGQVAARVIVKYFRVIRRKHRD